MKRGLLVVAACGSAPSLDEPPEPGPDGLVVHYELEGPPEDGVHATVGFDGRCSRCPTPVAGRIGAGYRFDATAEIIVAPAPPAYADDGPFTVALWALLEDRPPRNRCLFGELSDPLADPTGNTWQICADADAVFVCVPGGSELARACAFTAAGSLSLEVWHHVAATFDGTELRVYVDGGEVFAGPRERAPGTREFVIGADIDFGAVVGTVPGVLDDLKIWNRALSIPEIAREAAR